LSLPVVVVSFFFLESSTFFQRLAILLVTSFFGAGALKFSTAGVLGLKGLVLGLRARPPKFCRFRGLSGRPVPRRSISELEGVLFGGVSAAFLKLWLEDEVRIEVRETVEALDAIEEVDEFDPLRPPRVNDFSLSCCVFVVATSGLGAGQG